jgi:hypothetical protein
VDSQFGPAILFGSGPGFDPAHSARDEPLSGGSTRRCPKTIYLLYFHMEGLSARVAHERLIRKCFIDYDREMALVAEAVNPKTQGKELLGWAANATTRPLRRERPPFS